MNAASLDHEALRKALESAGLRCTPQRLAVYDRLTAGLIHPTAEEIFQTGRAQVLKEQGFQVTGYRLELVGYHDDGSGSEVPAATHAGSEPSPATRVCPAGADGTKT